MFVNIISNGKIELNYERNLTFHCRDDITGAFDLNGPIIWYEKKSCYFESSADYEN